MVPYYSFLIEIALTVLISFGLVRYLQSHLKHILHELCGTQERAHFWSAFSNLLLLGIPLIFSLGFSDQAQAGSEVFFAVARQLALNLSGLILALVGIGIFVAFFTLVAPRTLETEKK